MKTKKGYSTARECPCGRGVYTPEEIKKLAELYPANTTKIKTNERLSLKKD